MERTEADTSVAIVGGGLAGLALADRLHRAGQAFRLFEARPRFGGRIAALETPAGRVDLGPSWFWPGQPHIARLVDDLGLLAFAQHATGAACLEDAQGRVARGIGPASMAGAFRLDGGMVGLIRGLVDRLPRDRLHPGCTVACVEQGRGIMLADGRRIAARHVVLALPPRIAAGLRFDPALPSEVLDALRAIPTWMAGHAKFVAVYDRPFWRTAGLSGDAISRRGLLMEIHDASGADGTPAALFGFVGVPAPLRDGRAAQIEAAALQQLGGIFGPAAARPLACALQDWSCEPLTATAADRHPPDRHPAYGLPPALATLWGGWLQIAATETDRDSGGLMEGALAAAARAARTILNDPAGTRGPFTDPRFSA